MRLRNKLIIYPSILIISAIIFVIILDTVIMPWYVDEPEFVVPNFVGKNKTEAIDSLINMGLNPIEQGPRYNKKVPKDHIIYQNPLPGSMVKINRRVYLFISGGESLIRMPELKGKTIRDARVTLDRLDLKIGDVEKVRSEFQVNLVVGQDIEAGENIERGTEVGLKISMGPSLGKVRVPRLVGETLTDAKNILKNNSLQLGLINYTISEKHLPNTVHRQYPYENQLIDIGDSVVVWVTKIK